MKSIIYNIESYPLHKYFMLPTSGDTQDEMLAIRSKIELSSLTNIRKKGKQKDPKMNKELKKYYRNRYKLFSKFDEGIKLDYESWFSVTPEVIAEYLARRLKCNLILDGFCGSGGNSIQFAKYSRRVWAIDLDYQKIENALQNSKIYGVDNKITFFHSDYLEFTKPTPDNIDLVFLAPPWGGIKYNQKQYSIFEDTIPDIRQILRKAIQFSERIVLLMPRNSNISEYVQLFAELPNRLNLRRWCIEFEEIHLDGRLFEIAVYFGSSSLITKSHELRLYCHLIDPQIDDKLTKYFEMFCKIHGWKKVIQLYCKIKSENQDKLNNKQVFLELLHNIMKKNENYFEVQDTLQKLIKQTQSKSNDDKQEDDIIFLSMEMCFFGFITKNGYSLLFEIL